VPTITRGSRGDEARNGRTLDVIEKGVDMARYVTKVNRTTSLVFAGCSVRRWPDVAAMTMPPLRCPALRLDC